MSDPRIWLGAVAAAAAICALFGYSMGRRGHSRLEHEANEAKARVGRLERQVRERARERQKAKEPEAAQDGTVASLAMCLPHVVSELNRADLDVKEIPELILNLAEAIFKPTEALFYVTRRRNKDRELHLMSQRGLSSVPPEIRTIPFGKGKIGWVAENRLDKLKAEWRSLWRSGGGKIEDNHPSLHIDIVGPMMQHTDTGDNVLGVICLGEPSTHPRNEKLLFQMVTNLGSLALVGAMNVHRLRGQANHDGLTGLYNKSYFMREVSALMVAATRQAQRFAIFIFDIDHFKTYNDTNGHPAGDALLKGLSGLLKDCVRPGDWLCRYGGEEFMVAMPDTDGEAAMEVAETIRRTIEETPFEFQENQPNGNLTISGGVAVYPRDGHSLDELIQHADEALYQGKRGGRNAVTRYRCVELGSGEPETDIDLCPIDHR